MTNLMLAIVERVFCRVVGHDTSTGFACVNCGAIVCEQCLEGNEAA